MGVLGVGGVSMCVAPVAPSWDDARSRDTVRVLNVAAMASEEGSGLLG